MHYFISKFSVIFTACRFYSIPISIMSWLVPFILAILNGGKFLYGFIALLGIITLHMATNLFDDIIDYIKEKKDIEKGLKQDFNFQKGKCVCILNNLISLKQCFIICIVLFIISLLIGIFFINIWGFKLLYIIIPGGIICLLYPILGCMGLGEVLVAIIFSPVIYTGVYYVMTGHFSYEAIILSISTGLLTIAVLHNHMLLDYKYDVTNRKITLCRLSGSEKNALILLGIIIAASYLNLIIWVICRQINLYYLLPLITLPQAIHLMKEMNNHINNPDKNFLKKFLLMQNLLTSFTIILCLAIILDNIL